MKLNHKNTEIFEISMEKKIDTFYELLDKKSINIFTISNFIDDKELNVAGFQVYRTLLYDQIFEEQRKESPLYGTELHNSLINNGYIQINNFFDDDEFGKIQEKFFDAKERFNSIGGSTNFPVKFNVLRSDKLQKIIRLAQADESQSLNEFYMRQIVHCDTKRASDDSRQYRFHYDKFYPNFKIWFYVDKMTIDLGPTAAFAGSHRNSIPKMRWFYKSSLVKDTEWSRASLSPTEYIKEVNEKADYHEERIFTGNPNTFLLIDTRMLHRRTPAKPSTKRHSLRAILPRREKNAKM